MLFTHYIPVLLLVLSFCQGSLLPLQTDLKHATEDSTIETVTTAANAALLEAGAGEVGDTASEARGAIDANHNILPRPANLLLDTMPSASTLQVYPVNLTRQHEGDIFWTNGKSMIYLFVFLFICLRASKWLHY